MYISVTCPPVQLSHGQIDSTKSQVNGLYPFNTVISFSCDHGYSLDTSRVGSGTSITCLNSGYLNLYTQDVP